MPEADDAAITVRTLVDTPIPEHSPPRICPSNATRLSGLLLSPVSSMNSSFTHCRGHVSPAIHLTSAPSDRRPHTACRFPFRVYPPQQVVSSLRAGARWALRNSGGCASEQFPCSKTLPLLSLADETSGVWGLSSPIKSNGHRCQERPRLRSGPNGNLLSSYRIPDP